MTGDFVQSIKNLVDGIISGENHDGLIQTLRGPRDEFRKAIRQTAPYFLPLGSAPIFIDDVLENANL